MKNICGSALVILLMLIGGCNQTNNQKEIQLIPNNLTLKLPIRLSLLKEIEYVMKETKDMRSKMMLFYNITFYNEKGVEKIRITYSDQAETYIYDIGTAENPRKEFIKTDLTGRIAFIKYKHEYIIFNITNDIYKTFIDKNQIITDLEELRDKFPPPQYPEVFDPRGYFYEIITPDNLLFLQCRGI